MGAKRRGGVGSCRAPRTHSTFTGLAVRAYVQYWRAACPDMHIDSDRGSEYSSQIGADLRQKNCSKGLRFLYVLKHPRPCRKTWATSRRRGVPVQCTSRPREGGG